MPDRREAKSFEPPPWEREAFERFQAAARAAEAEAELSSALQALREPKTDTSDTEAAVAAAPGDETTPGPEAIAPEPTAPRLAEATMDAMLIELQGEEPIGTHRYTGFASAVVAIFAAFGFYLLVQAAVLFGRVGPEAGLLGALVSLMILIAGLMFLGGAALLYRRYHS